MLTVGAELAAAIEAPERAVRVRMSVDWDGDGHGSRDSLDDVSDTVARVSVARVLQGTVPDQAAIVEGTAAATLDADLAGGDSTDERLDAVRYFSPVSTLSPLVGKERLGRDVLVDVEVLTGSGWKALPLFRGASRALPVSVRDARAQLSAIDYRSRLRTPVSLPAMIAEAPDYTAASTFYPSKPGLEGTWVVSYVLWRCGLPLSPPAQGGCRLWIPMHGSAQPFVQQLGAGSPPTAFWDGSTVELARAPEFVEGPFVLASEGRDSAGHYLTGAQVPPAAGTAMFDASGRSAGKVELWVKANSAAQASVTVFAYAGTMGFIAINLGVGAWSLDLTNGGTTRNIAGPTVAADGAWHRVGVRWDDAAGTAFFIRDGAETAVTFTPTPVTTGVTDVWGVSYTFTAPVAELHVVTGADAATWLPLTWSPAARVDRSQLRLTGIVDTASREGWQHLQDLAAAEGGSAWYDAAGQLEYATSGRQVAAAAQTPQRVFTARSHVLELAMDYRLDTVFNVIAVPYQPVTMARQVDAWTLGSTVRLAPGATVTVVASLSSPIATTFTSFLGRANTRADGAGTQYSYGTSVVSTFVFGAMTFLTPTAVEFTIRNALGAPVWLVDTSGQPAITITADVVSQSAAGDSPTISNAPSRATYGDQPLNVLSSPWIQTWSHAAGLGMALAADLGRPLPALTGLEVPGDPRLEPYDRFTVQDPDNTELSADFWLVGARSIVEGGAFTQEVAARSARARYLAGVGAPGIDVVG